MEIHRSKLAAKKLWRLVRVALILLKRGLISKRHLIVDLNLALKKIRLIRKPIRNLLLLSNHHNPAMKLGRRGGDYEFSCRNTLNPVFPRVSFRLRKHHPNLLSCIGAPLVIEDDAVVIDDNQSAVVLLPRTPEFGAGELLVSPEWWSGEESEGGREGVDDEAEEFIRKFYEQLRNQSRPQLLEY